MGSEPCFFGFYDVNFDIFFIYSSFTGCEKREVGEIAPFLDKSWLSCLNELALLIFTDSSFNSETYLDATCTSVVITSLGCTGASSARAALASTGLYSGLAGSLTAAANRS